MNAYILYLFHIYRKSLILSIHSYSNGSFEMLEFFRTYK